MLMHGSKLIGQPVMSLQTGTQVATTKRAIINPHNLKIVAYEVEGQFVGKETTLLRVDEIREMGRLGMIIDSADEFVTISDVIELGKIYALNFDLVDETVLDQREKKIGKVSEYIVEPDGFIVFQILVKQRLLKGLLDDELTIHRSQIIEINDEGVIVKSGVEKARPIVGADTYVNPFRKRSANAESAHSDR